MLEISIFIQQKYIVTNSLFQTLSICISTILDVLFITEFCVYLASTNKTNDVHAFVGYLIGMTFV